MDCRDGRAERSEFLTSSRKRLETGPGFLPASQIVHQVMEGSYDRTSSARSGQAPSSGRFSIRPLLRRTGCGQSLDALDISDPRYPKIPARMALSDTERAKATEMLSRLTYRLSPAPVDEIAKCCAMVRGCMRLGRRTKFRQRLRLRGSCWC